MLTFDDLGWVAVARVKPSGQDCDIRRANEWIELHRNGWDMVILLYRRSRKGVECLVGRRLARWRESG